MVGLESQDRHHGLASAMSSFVAGPEWCGLGWEADRQLSPLLYTQLPRCVGGVHVVVGDNMANMLSRSDTAKVLFTSALGALALCIPVSWAQNAPQPTTLACEMRIFTTDNVQVADSTDFKDAGLVGGFLSGLYEKQDPLLAHDIAQSEIGAAAQERIMAASLTELPPRFSGYAVSFEAGGQRPLAAFQAARRSPRLSSSSASCQAEIAVVAATYVRTSLSRTFGFAFMYREFGINPRANKVITFGSSQKVTAFPPKTPADIPAARVELRQAFERAFPAFLAKIAKAK